MDVKLMEMDALDLILIAQALLLNNFVKKIVMEFHVC